MNDDIKHLSTDFGMIAIPPEMEPYITEKSEREINRMAEQIYAVGGCLSGRAELVREAIWNDASGVEARQLGVRIYIRLHYTGEAMVAVAEEMLL